MKSLDYTLDKLPGSQLEIPYEHLPLSNPAPILQQPKSEITTNPYIVPSDKYNKFALFDGVIPGPAPPGNSNPQSTLISIVSSTLSNMLSTPSTPSIVSLTQSTPSPFNQPHSTLPSTLPSKSEVPQPENQSFSKIIEKTSMTFTGILDDIYEKPDNVSWSVYLKQILVKDNRYNYVAIILFFIALYILLVK
jgi:hypothetical protein